MEAYHKKLEFNVHKVLGTGTVMKMGMGRQHSWSVGENHCLCPQLHQQQEAYFWLQIFPPCVGMRPSAGGEAGGECLMGQGRQRSCSMGGGVHS